MPVASKAKRTTRPTYDEIVRCLESRAHRKADAVYLGSGIAQDLALELGVNGVHSMALKVNDKRSVHVHVDPFAESGSVNFKITTNDA